MRRLIVPDNMGRRVTSFFTGRDPGADPEIISGILGISRKQIFLPIQKHTDKVAVIGSLHEPVIADAVITAEKGLLIGVQVADCVPVLIHDPDRNVVAAVHAGWRGTAQEILKKTVQALVERYFCDPKRLQLAIGPSIRRCCYEVDGDVLRSVVHASGAGDFHGSRGDKACLDLPSANRLQALGMGLQAGNIWMSSDCTFCSPEKYFSYRYARGSAGRQAAFIGIF